MYGPDPKTKHPLPDFPRVCFIKNTVSNPQIEIGDYTYYDDPEDSEDFERNVLYHYPFIGDRLIIGKFCALAQGVSFIMNGANHPMSGVSSYPFYIFGHGWESSKPAPEHFPFKGDTRIGHDVWIGRQAVILPGVQVGDGAIIAAHAVVTSDVEPYTVIGGNPAALIKRRVSPTVAAQLQELAWWNWPIETITQHLESITTGNLDELHRVSPNPS